MKRNAIRFCIVFFFFAGCQGRPARTAHDVRSGETIKGLASVTWDQAGGAVTSDAAIVVAPPGRFRIELMDAIADVWAAIGSDGHRLWMWDVQKRKAYAGRATPGRLRRWIDFAGNVDDLSRILAGRYRPPAESSGEKKRYEVVYSGALRGNIPRTISIFLPKGFVTIEYRSLEVGGSVDENVFSVPE